MRWKVSYVLMCLPILGQQAVTPVASTESRQPVRAFSASGEITLPSLRVQVDVPNPDKEERGDVAVVFDPKSRVYLWRYVAFSSPTDTYSALDVFASSEAIYVERDRIVRFSRAWPYVTEYRDRASSLEAARDAVFGWLQGGHASLSKYGVKPAPRSVGIDLKEFSEGSILPRMSREDYMMFHCGSMFTSFCPWETEIISVFKRGKVWSVIFRKHWDQEVILDAKFNYMSTRQLTPPLNESGVRLELVPLR